jgi:hypothetical protein
MPQQLLVLSATSLVLRIFGWIHAHAGLVVIGVLGTGLYSWWKARGRARSKSSGLSGQTQVTSVAWVWRLEAGLALAGSVALKLSIHSGSGASNS